MKLNTLKPNNSKSRMDDSDSASVSYVSLPYIKGTSEIISRLLQSHKIRVAHRLISTLCNVAKGERFRWFIQAIYRIPCNEP